MDALDAWDIGIPFAMGNIIKYTVRAGRKDGEDPVEAAEKAVWYANWLVRRYAHDRKIKRKA